jgi:hypothetical protein
MGMGIVEWMCSCDSRLAVTCEGGMDGVPPPAAGQSQPPDCGLQDTEVVRAIELPAASRPTAGPGWLPGGGP